MVKLSSVLLTAVCAVMACLSVGMLSGCRDSEAPSPEKNSSISDASADSVETSSAESENEASDASESSNTKEDEKVSSEAESTAEKPEENRTPEAAVMTGYYSFDRSDFKSVYSNSELEKCFDELEKICSESDYELAFAYKNLETGANVTYNSYGSFLTCSTIKAPYVKYILSQDINLDEVIVRDTCWTDDDGAVAMAPYGMKYTVRQLIEYAICESDNTAYYLLFRRFGYEGFNNMLYDLGANYDLGYSWIFTYCTVTDMLRCYEDVYNFGEESKYGKLLISLMEQSDLNIQISAALGDKYKVAHKYGSEFDEITFNDCAIVYADSPYVLCIFTNQYPETEESCEVFKELAVVFDEINSLIAS